MDVKTVCLGMLTDGAASGYDLKKHFESSFGHFFAAGYGSIYPALSSLAEQGLVDCECIPQDGKPDRKVYAITALGRHHLIEALDNPCPSHKVRSEFLATLCFAHLMTAKQIQTVIDSRVDEVEDYLEVFEELETSCMSDWSPSMQFVAGFGKAMTVAMKIYLQENQHLLLEEKSSHAATA